MAAKARVFLDTSVLFAAVLSETGGSRVILQLGEAGLVQLLVGPRVLAEADAVLDRKAPHSKALFALLLDQARVKVGPEARHADLANASRALSYEPDARVLAEALAAGVDYLVTLDKQHLLGNEPARTLPLLIGSPGDFLAWLRSRLSQA